MEIPDRSLSLLRSALPPFTEPGTPDALRGQKPRQGGSAGSAEDLLLERKQSHR